MSDSQSDLLELMLSLNRRGIRLYLQDGELRFRAHRGTMTPDVKTALRGRREELMRLLQQANYDTNCVVTINRGSPARTPLFCPHTVHGGVFDYLALAQAMDADQPVYAFQGLSFLCGESVRTSVEEMANYYVSQLEALWPRGPVLLYGASSGGLIALEMARQLTEAQRPIRLVALGDTIDPQFYGTLAPNIKDRLYWVGFVESFLSAEVLEINRDDHTFWTLDETARLHYLVQATARAQTPGRLGRIEFAALEQYHRAFQTYKAAFYSYEVRPFEHKMLYFRADPPKPERFEPIIAKCKGDVTVVPMQCNHIQMIRPPGAYRLAARLQAAISKQE